MTTEKKSASNRRNARKSTGPRSAAGKGKAVVSRNALKHGLLSRHLIVEGESQAEFSELLRLLAEEFRPVGLVENALVERVGIALWRQRRLVRAESAEVSINQHRFGPEQKQEIGKVLDLGYNDYSIIMTPDVGHGEADVDYLRDQKNLWQFLVDKGVADADDPFAAMPEDLRQAVQNWHRGKAGKMDEAVKAEFGSWEGLFVNQALRFDLLIRKRRIPKVSRLVMQRQALPSQTDLLARYQTALDNDLYKALKALREAQAWRQARAVIDVPPASPEGDGTASDHDT